MKLALCISTKLEYGANSSRIQHNFIDAGLGLSVSWVTAPEVYSTWGRDIAAVNVPHDRWLDAVTSMLNISPGMTF